MTHHKTGFLLLNISVALKNKLQTCWLLKKIVYTDKKKTRSLIYTNSPMVLRAIRRLCAYTTRQEQSSGEKKMFPLSMYFSSYQMLCPFFLKQNVLPLGPLATLARLHDHIRQLLHLEMRRISVNCHQCCFILDAVNMLVVVPYAACPRSTGWAVAPMSEEHSRAEQKPPGCGVYKGPRSV